MNVFKNIEMLMMEIEKLQEAHSLLERVYNGIGPYGYGKIDEKTRYDLNDYFGFDDSE